MLSEAKLIQLSGFLGQLPESVAQRLAKAVEVDRLVGNSGLPHDDILEALRPQLRTAAEPVTRVPTPERFFCRPFEDLLVGERAVKQKGRIARSSIMPVWQWLADELIPAQHKALSAALREAIVEAREERVEQACADVWAQAAIALKERLNGDDEKHQAARKLGGRAVAEDAAEMALLLGGAAHVLAVQNRLPKPASLTDEDVAFLRDTFDRLSESNPDLAPYVALIAMGRLQRPWEALRLTAALSRKSNDTVISNTDLGAVGEILFADLDSHVQKIRAARPVDFDSETLLAGLAAFAELSSGIVKELGIRRDGKWGQRLAKSRSAVAETIESLLDRAPKEILSALPPARPGASGKGPGSLDFGRAPDPERVAKAMRYAHLMIHSRPFAVASAFNAKLSAAMDETIAALRMSMEDLLREAKADPGDVRSHVRQYLEIALDLCTLVLGQEEADLFRRRARVVTSG